MPQMVHQCPPRDDGDSARGGSWMWRRMLRSCSLVASRGTPTVTTSVSTLRSTKRCWRPSPCVTGATGRPQVMDTRRSDGHPTVVSRFVIRSSQTKSAGKGVRNQSKDEKKKFGVGSRRTGRRIILRFVIQA